MNGDERISASAVQDEGSAGDSRSEVDERSLSEQVSRFREDVSAKDASSDQHVPDDATEPSVEKDVHNISEDVGGGESAGVDDSGEPRASRGREATPEGAATIADSEAGPSADDVVSPNPGLGDGQEDSQSGSEHGDIKGASDERSSEQRAVDAEVRESSEAPVIGSTPSGEVREGTRSLFGGVWI